MRSPSAAAVTRCAATGLAITLLGCATAPPPITVTASPAPRAFRTLPPIDGVLGERVARVTAAFAARGAAVTDARWSAFLREGSFDGFTLAIDRPQCVGLVAVGPEGVTDLDLFALSETGAELARDSRGDAHPYLRVCVREPGALRVMARAARGSGQVAALVVASPPLVPPPLDAVLDAGSVGMVAGPRTPRGAIGRDPARPPPAELARRLVAAQTAQGWRPVGATLEGALHHQEIATRDISLEAGGCYLFQGAGGDGVDDLDLVVHDPGGDAIAQDLALDAQPAVRVCADRPGVHRVEVRMYAGEGSWALSTLAMNVPRARPAPGLDPVARARWTEAALEAESRGMDAAMDAVRGAPWGALAQSIPLPLQAGRCYLAAAAADAQAVALDLWIADAAGAVLASDTGERERATVFYCAPRASAASLHVRTPNGRGSWVLQAFASGGAS